MKQEVKIGQADYSVLVLIRDSTTGAPKTALTNASAGIDVCYTRVETDNDVVLTDGAPAALATPALTDVHLDWGFLLVDDTKAPGLYRLDIPDGVFAAGAWSAVVSLICTGCDPVHIEFALTTNTKDDLNGLLAHTDYGLAKLVRSTTPANTLDVSATGEAGLDFANIKNATGAHTLSNITVPVVTTVGTCTTNTDMRGTDSAALASVCTEARLSELDAGTGGKMANQVDIIQTDTTTDIPAVLTSMSGATFDTGTDSLEALRNRGDAAWITATSVTVSDKTGFSLASTGADLILKSSTFVQAIVAAINELATYGLTALNTLLVTTGIKTATTAAPTDMALNSTVAKEATLTLMKGATFDTATDSLEAIRNRGDAAWGAGAVPSVADIADGVWDEAIADHLVAGSTGAKLNTAAAAAGTGAITWTYTVTDADTGLPIDGVSVWVTTDSAGANVIASGTTNDSGVVTFYLDAGTVYVWRSRAGYNFSNPDTEIVS